jgi:tetratricopeptide (TPR) repeat protein
MTCRRRAVSLLVAQAFGLLVPAPLIVHAAPSSQASPSPPSGRTADDVARTLATARTLITDGKPREAIAKLDTLDASVPQVAHLLGVAYYHADDHQRAIELLTGARPKLAADSMELRETVQILGLCYYLTGRFSDAIPLLEQTRTWVADNLELGYILGQAYIQSRQPEAARRSLARSFGVPPESAAAHVIAAQVMIRLEMEPLAETELKRALEKDSHVPRANYLLGQIALFRGRLDEAIALSERELAINPSDAMALVQIGDAHIRGSRWDAAIPALQKSLWLNPYYSGPYILLGRAYMQKGQAATAEGMLRRGIQYDPNNRSAHYVLGQLLQQTGRADEAKKEFEIAEKLK